MSFTVVRQGESNGSECRAYFRLLRKQGADLGNWPRVLAPGGERWLPVWDTEEEAAAFVEELKRRSNDPNWDVLPVEAPISRGPLGPIEVLLGRMSDSWAFEIPPLSRAILQSAFPDADGPESLSLGVAPGKGPRKEGVASLLDKIVELLTGLPLEQLRVLGYVVRDSGTGKEVIHVGPQPEAHEGASVGNGRRGGSRDQAPRNS